MEGNAADSSFLYIKMPQMDGVEPAMKIRVKDDAAPSCISVIAQLVYKSGIPGGGFGL